MSLNTKRTVGHLLYEYLFMQSLFLVAKIISYFERRFVVHGLLADSLMQNRTYRSKGEIKVYLHWAKANVFLWSLSVLNVHIKLDSLWTHLEAMLYSLLLSPQYKRTLLVLQFNRRLYSLDFEFDSVWNKQEV